MGRYYDGDIEGKFWFAVQDSDDADFFGCVGRYPEHSLVYDFNEEHLPKVKEGLDICLKKLGADKKKLDDFFEENNGYNDKIVETWFWDKHNEKMPEDKFRNLLVWYARFDLGNKIYKCLKEKGYCSFEAEV